CNMRSTEAYPRFVTALTTALQASIQPSRINTTGHTVAVLAGRSSFLVGVCVGALMVSCLQAPAGIAGPFDGRGMWIWEVPRTDGGNPTAIAKQASANGVKTLFVKSGDGVNYWGQFSRR